MSWGAVDSLSEVGNSASYTVNSANSTAGAASNAASAAGNTASTAGSMTSSVGTAAAETGASSAATNAGASGYSIDAGQAGQNATPSWWDNAMDGLEKFQKGSQQSLPEAYRNWGNNPQTYGYIAGKGQGFAAGGGGNQPANVTTNINYQPPENDYLRRRRGY